MRGTGVLLAIAVCCSAALGGERSDLMIGDQYLDIEYRAGSGPHRSIVIVDFAATGGASYAFEYRYEETKNGHNALTEIADAGELDYDFEESPFGIFVKALALGSDQGDGGLGWSYSTGVHDPAAATVSWESSQVGVTDRILTDGSWDGWYNGFGPAPDYAAIPPAIPTVVLPGDYDDNGHVAQGDLDLVLLHWGAGPEIPGWVNQRPTDDGVVDQNDLDGVLLYWGDTVGVGAGVVPEPHAALLACLGFVLWVHSTSARQARL